MGSPAAVTCVRSFFASCWLQRSTLCVNRYGPIFVGVVFNIVLYGIMITQTFLYFTVYKRSVSTEYQFDRI